ncbi:MAG: FkbM family methyltransferase [Pseudomonadota bacterium]|nr:FkbM family methyltransferase [Pseudomonadota bacterium]
MRTATLPDGTRVHCLVKAEALVLDHHVHGYLGHGVALHEGDIVFDVGANIGLFGIRAVQRHAGLRVFAFEPVPAIYAVLQANAVSLGDGRLVALPCGLSREPGHIDIDYFPNSPALSTADVAFWDNNPDALREAVVGNVRNAPPELWYARLVPKFLAGAIAWNMRRGAQRVRCELRTVSQVMRDQGLDRIDLLKVDCEGAELDVLLGVDDAHWPHIGAVVAEVADVDGRLAAVRALLVRHGLDRIVIEREAGFEATPMVNVFATRSAPS